MALDLINKTDSFEIVRDQIAAILVSELANQQALAPGASKDPLDYTLAVYVERDLPVEAWLNAGSALDAATVPRVNVWLENTSIRASSSSHAAARQVYDCTYNIDVLARGLTANVGAGGYLPADTDARKRCHAAVRLVRNILAATEHIWLKLRGTVVWGTPTLEGMDFGPAQIDESEPDVSVWGCRMRFRVPVTEYSPEFTGFDNLDTIRVDITEDGQIILSSEFQ